jgi:hypothetical protein
MGNGSIQGGDASNFLISTSKFDPAYLDMSSAADPSFMPRDNDRFSPKATIEKEVAKATQSRTIVSLLEDALMAVASQTTTESLGTVLGKAFNLPPSTVALIDNTIGQIANRKMQEKNGAGHPGQAADSATDSCANINKNSEGKSKAKPKANQSKADNTPDANWKGNEAIGVGPLVGTVEEATARMYARADVELDAVFGKGQYPKPRGHEGYCAKLQEASNLMSREQKAAFKDRMEIIGQDLHVNWTFSRNRVTGSVVQKIPLNLYAQNSFSTEQEFKEKSIKAEYFAQRDAIARRSKQK